MRLLPLLILLLTALHAQAALPPYYGGLTWSSSSELKDKLFLVLDGFHKASPGADNIGTTCPGTSTCFRHRSLTYSMARKNLFGFLHLTGNSPSTYALFTYYCPAKITNKDLPSNKPLAPLAIPSPSVLNAEHTWPQSKFSKKFPDEQQKGDLHILLPVHSNVNSIRGNHPYGIVVQATSTPCGDAALGLSAEHETVFEPADDDKGDAARAIFYFSVRYKMPIDKNQERYLRLWHKQDPVDQEEFARNEKVFQLQKNRNPFIDAPEMVGQIEDF